MIRSELKRSIHFIRCCGSGSKLKGRIWIRIRVISWIRIRINVQMTSQNVWIMSRFEYILKVMSLYFGDRVRIRIKVKSRIRFWIRIKVMRISNTVLYQIYSSYFVGRLVFTETQ
jgi:hypothetical protein